jgi:hypothetical protein
MLRKILLATALTLAACDQAGSGPPLPEVQESAATRPSQQQAAPAEGQVRISPELRVQLEDLMRAYLEEAAQRYGSGTTQAAGFSDEIIDLQPGTDHRWRVNLKGGTQYRFLGACDDECWDVDLELISSDGGVVASDLSPCTVSNLVVCSFAHMDFTAPEDGAYIVRIMMQGCTVAPCYAGARVMSAGAGSPS